MVEFNDAAMSAQRVGENGAAPSSTEGSTQNPVRTVTSSGTPQLSVSDPVTRQSP